MRRLLLIASLCGSILLPSWADAARLFTSGLEENSTTTTMLSSVGAGFSIDTTSPHSGTYSGLFSGNTGKNLTRSLSAAITTDPTTIYARWYWRTDSLAFNSRIFSDRSSGGTHGMQVTVLSTGVVRLTNAVSTTSVDTSATLSINTSYRFEIEHVISDTTGDMTVRVYAGDATSPIEEISLPSAEDTLPTNIRDFVWEESASSASINARIDDIAINDTSGSFQTSWPGVGNVYLLVANSDVANAWEDETAGASTFANLDGLPTAVDDTDYNTEVATLNSVDRFGLTDLGAAVGASDTIVLLDVYARVGSNQTSAANMRMKLWDEGGTLTDGPTANANVNGWKILTTAEHLAYDASGKTKANISSFNAGYENITDVATRPRNVSELWVNVEWKAASAAAAPRGLLLGVYP